MDIDALLNAEKSSDRVAQIARVALNQGNPPAEYPKYFAALDQALENEPPPFDTEAYVNTFREASKDGRWMAISLMTNAEREGDGATRLWSLAACSPNEEEKQLLKRHAVDESGHSLAYLALLDIAFPGSVTSTFREELKQLSPHYTMDQEPSPVEGSPYARVPSIDDYVQMNIAEIRTTIHHIMQRAALANYCPEENVPRMNKILDALLRDELSHVAYTARLIEQKGVGTDPNRLPDLYSKRLRDFNTITHKELREKIFD